MKTKSLEALRGLILMIFSSCLPALGVSLVPCSSLTCEQRPVQRSVALYSVGTAGERQDFLTSHRTTTTNAFSSLPSPSLKRNTMLSLYRNRNIHHPSHANPIYLSCNNRCNRPSSPPKLASEIAFPAHRRHASSCDAQYRSTARLKAVVAIHSSSSAG